MFGNSLIKISVFSIDDPGPERDSLFPNPKLKLPIF